MRFGLQNAAGGINSPRAGFFAAPVIIAAIVGALGPIHDRLSPTTIALAMLLTVLLVATIWGTYPAYLASILGMLCFNFFFLPPIGTFHIADPQNWIALFAFLVTSLVVGKLSAEARRRAAIAETRRREVERLYDELKAAFERASEAEALRRSEQLKSALLDAVTHDLRTPLTSIKMSVTMLLAERKAAAGLTLDEEGEKELLEVIDEEADRLNHFIENMVELARLESGEFQLRRHWCSLDEMIDQVLARATPLTGRFRIDVHLEKNLPSVQVDTRALAEVVYILLDNAVKYSPPGSRILIAAERESGSAIRISVEDEGGGIPLALREKVFDKFFRVKTGDGPNLPGGGLGMGLAIARGIVEAHRGHIRIEETSTGRGARFVLTIPIDDEEHHD